MLNPYASRSRVPRRGKQAQTPPRATYPSACSRSAVISRRGAGISPSSRYFRGGDPAERGLIRGRWRPFTTGAIQRESSISQSCVPDLGVKREVVLRPPAGFVAGWV